MDGMYDVAKRRANKILTGLNVRSVNNGEASMIHSSEFFFSSAGFALVKMVGRNIRAVGPDKGTGMPTGRTGAIVDLLSHAAGFFACLDAGPDGTSALMFRSDAKQGWHELFRAWKTGARVQKKAS